MKLRYMIEFALRGPSDILRWAGMTTVPPHTRG